MSAVSDPEMRALASGKHVADVTCLVSQVLIAPGHPLGHQLRIVRDEPV